MKEERVVIENNVETLKSGYFLTIDQLQKLVAVYVANLDFMGDTKTFIENWINANVK